MDQGLLLGGTDNVVTRDVKIQRKERTGHLGNGHIEDWQAQMRKTTDRDISTTRTELDGETVSTCRVPKDSAGL